MPQLILFHHAQGLTDGVRSFAEQLRGAGHKVHVPDLYDGATFPTVEEGVAHVEQLGFENIIEAGEKVAGQCPADIVYAGFSLGALIAHKLAQTRAAARGALLYHHGDVPIDTFGDTWPAGVDVQIHVNERDEFCELPIVEDFVEQAAQTARAELFLYPGSTHLFADFSLPNFEPESAALVVERTLDFLRRV